VVRKDQVGAAAVDVELIAQCLAAMAEHSMCQPGRPRAHGLGHDGSPSRARFQSANRADRACQAPALCGGDQLAVQIAVTELAVVRKAGDVEVTSPVSVE